MALAQSSNTEMALQVPKCRGHVRTHSVHTTVCHKLLCLGIEAQSRSVVSKMDTDVILILTNPSHHLRHHRRQREELEAGNPSYSLPPPLPLLALSSVLERTL